MAYLLGYLFPVGWYLLKVCWNDQAKESSETSTQMFSWRRALFVGRKQTHPTLHLVRRLERGWNTGPQKWWMEGDVLACSVVLDWLSNVLQIKHPCCFSKASPFRMQLRARCVARMEDFSSKSLTKGTHKGAAPKRKHFFCYRRGVPNGQR